LTPSTIISILTAAAKHAHSEFNTFTSRRDFFSFIQL
jgi:hypothetical protein